MQCYLFSFERGKTMLCSVEVVGEVIEKLDDEEGVPYIVVKVERPFLNKEHQPVYDQYIVYGWGGIIETPRLYYEVGDYICIRGRLENHKQFPTIIIGEYMRLLYRNKK